VQWISTITIYLELVMAALRDDFVHRRLALERHESEASGLLRVLASGDGNRQAVVMAIGMRW
jgi:hypothetical protein